MRLKINEQAKDNTSKKATRARNDFNEITPRKILNFFDSIRIIQKELVRKRNNRSLEIELS